MNRARRVALALVAMLAVVLLPTEAWGAAPSNGVYTPDAFSIAYVTNTTSSNYAASGSPLYVSRCTSSGSLTCAAHYDLDSTGTYGTLGSMNIRFFGMTVQVLAGDPAVTVSYTSRYRCATDAVGSYRTGTQGNKGLSATGVPVATQTNIGVGSACTVAGNAMVESQVAFATAWSTTGVVTAYGPWIPFLFSGAPGYTSPAASVCVGASVDTTSWIAALDPATSKLSLLFTWPGLALPTNTWNLRQGAGSSDTLLGTISKTYRSGSSNYGFDGRVMTGLSPGSTLRIESTDTPGCYGTVQILGSGTSITDTSGLSGDGTASCAIVDIACLLRAAERWAFVPSPGTVTSWQSQIATWSAHPPLSFVLSASSAVAGFAHGVKCGGLGGHTTSYADTCASGDQGANHQVGSDSTTTGKLTVVTGTHAHPVTTDYNILGAAGALMGEGGSMHPLYVFLDTLALLGVLLWAWRRLSLSFGSKEHPE